MVNTGTQYMPSINHTPSRVETPTSPPVHISSACDSAGITLPVAVICDHGWFYNEMIKCLLQEAAYIENPLPPL